jgi:hypothetical protein
MPITLKRYNSIRRADDTDDQQGSPSILGALVASETQEELQVYFLSRLRQVIFGETSPEHWYDDFLGQGILSLKELTALSGGAGLVRVGVELVGPKNGANRIFRTTPDFFVHDPSGSGKTIELYHNGRLLVQTDTYNPGLGDYVVEESGGVGTGFDTVNLLTFSPIERSSLVASYHRA